MSKCLVVLSGGQDSTTCAALAKIHFDEVHALTFNYGQRHAIEIESALAVGEALGVASHEVLSLGEGILKGTSPLVSNNPLGQYKSVDELPGGVEPTFIPARNILFLTLAANRAAVLGCSDIYIGVCEADFAGYWDCRMDFIKAMAEALSQGLYGNTRRLSLHTPLMYLTKSESVKLAQRALVDKFDDVMSLTHTCYGGVKGGCGHCHACLIRDRGFIEAGIADPIWKHRQPATDLYANLPAVR